MPSISLKLKVLEWVCFPTQPRIDAFMVSLIQGIKDRHVAVV